MLGKIKKDILKLRGKTVNVFGQPCTIEKGCGQFTIDIVNVIDALKPYEVNTRNAGVFIDRLIESGLIDCNCKSDNTYNFGAPVSNDMYYHIYNKKNNNGCYIVISIHRYGDVRGNYTDEAVLLFNSVDEFYEVLYDCNIYTSIDVDGKTYSVDVNFFSDTLEVYDDTGAYICNSCGYEASDIINDIRKAV